MPNTQNIQKLIDKIKSVSDDLVIMGGWGPSDSCGTAHCIGGWADVIKRNEKKCQTTGDWLGINCEQTGNLFYLYCIDMELCEFDRYPAHIRKEAVLQVLTKLKDTGKVDWHTTDDWMRQQGEQNSQPNTE